jgi:flagellar FliJ protein
MARYRFRLATLLRLREAARDERRGELAEALRALDALRQSLEAVDRELAETRRREAAPLGRVEVDVLVDAHRYELVLRLQRKEIERQVTLVAQEVDRRRQALVEADADVKVLEKLRETQKQRALVEEGRREIKLLDEVASRGWHGEPERAADGEGR